MPDDFETRDAPYWSAAVERGQPAAWVFEGRDGLDRLSGPGTYSADNVGAFRARLTRVQLDHVAIEAFGATAPQWVRTPEQIRRSETTLLMFVLVAAGRLRVNIDEGSFDLEGGDCVIVDSREPISYACAGDVRMLRSMVGIEHIPAHLQKRGTMLAGPLERTPLIESFIALGSATLKASTTGRPVGGPHLVRAAAELQRSVLAEAQEMRSLDPGEVSLRERIEEHIEQHLGDPELGPRSIAASLGISLRHVHGTFNQDDRTVSRAIREHRLAAVAIELQTADEVLDLEDLAARYGFSSPTALRRAFRAKYNMSPEDHHRHGHRTLN